MRGFTLIEMLLAIAVTVVISSATANLVFQFVETRGRTEWQLLRVEQWQRLSDRWTEDLSTHAALRNVRAPDEEEPALQVTAEPVVSLTRLGWSRPAFQPPHRSELQRIRYRLMDWENQACTALRARQANVPAPPSGSQCLVRQYTRHLDRLVDADWQSQPLAGPLRSMSVQVAVSGPDTPTTEVPEWPVSDDAGSQEMNVLPVMLTITLVYAGEPDSPVHLSGALTGFHAAEEGSDGP